MKFTSLVVTSLAVTTAVAAPVDDFWNRLRSFRDGTVVPIAPKNNQAGVRYEINTMQSTQALQFTLFIQGLTSMQKDQQTRLGSFYALSGIHGRPFSPWNNEPTCGRCVSNSGYCVHQGLMFATWHRPYLSLFEQWIWRYAYSWLQSRKLSGVELAKWQSALEKLRLPYWDWTRNGGSLPRSTTDASLRITLPNGQSTVVSNPLNVYNFHWPTVNGRQRVDDLGPIGQQFPRGSIRSPTSRGQQDNNRSNAVMRGQWGALSRGVYEMMMNPRYKTYGAMVRQLENLHNIVHGAVGNGGHMTYIDVAAFDPIFWLHHCMIDRLFDIWQAINPNVRFTERVRFRGTFEISSTDQDAASTYLKPFRGTRRCPSENLQQCHVNSNDVWSTMTHGYFYHDTRNRNPGTVQSWVNNNISRTGKKLKKRAMAAGGPPAPANATSEVSDVKILNDYTWRGTVNIDPKACGGTTCYVHLFAGQPSSNPADWLTQKELIGSTVVLGMAPKQELSHNSTEYLFGNGTHLDQDSHMGGMKMAKLIEGTVEFNGYLDEYEGVPSNCPKVIEPWLTKNLQIRVQKANGEEVPISSLPSLKVGIKSQPYGAPSTPEEAPTYGTEKLYRDITKNIIGGLGRCDTLGKGLPF